MRVLFFQDHGINESPALAEAAAVLRADGHHVSLALESEDPGARGARAARPDLVVVPSSVTDPAFPARAVPRLRSRLRVPVVLAGSLPTLWPQALSFVPADAAVRGEAELPLLALVRGMDRGEDPAALAGTDGIVAFRDGALVNAPPPAAPEDLDSLPLPARDVYYEGRPWLSGLSWKKFLSSRGCSRGCGHCYLAGVQALYGRGMRRIRAKSVGRVIAEVGEVRRRWPLRQLHFVDDAFAAHPEWARELAERWPGEIGIPFTCNTLAECLSEGTVASLATAGCRAVCVGVEVGDEEARRVTYRKGTTDALLREVAERLRRHRIHLVTLNMVGGPGDSPESAMQAMRLSWELGARYARVTLVGALHGTPLRTTAEAAGSLLGEGDPARQAPLGAGLSFRVEREEEVLNVFHLFRLGVRFPALGRAIPTLARLPIGPLRPVLGLSNALTERALHGIGVLEGMRYAWHGGLPQSRTAHFPSLL
ncbi:radical SAM protein [Myxococcota bacterium]|nr:radical SAM protein [Myxococcota bacterium]